METPHPPSHRRFWLPGAALLALLILLISPTSRWLVKTQFMRELAPKNEVNSLLRDLGVKDSDSSAASNADYRPLQQAADRYPDDFDRQFAAALMIPTDGDKWESRDVVMRLERLVDRFRDKPALYAAILRYRTMGTVMVHRGEEAQLSPPSKQKTAYSVSDVSKPCKPDDLAAFDQAAAQGERLDPDNAYFPFIRAVGLFNANRDEEAVEAVHRAAQKPRFDDYTSEDALSKDRLSKLAYGERGAIARTALYASLLFPHYAQLRATARMATVNAIEVEQAGNESGYAEAGYTIRRDMMRLGSLMRVQSHSFIGTLVGIACTQIAMGRPGGAPAIERKQNETNDPKASERYLQEHLDKYCAYLEQIGHPEETNWVRAEFTAGAQAKKIGREGLQKSVLGGLELESLSLWWGMGQVVLANVFWMLMFAYTAAYLLRHHMVKGAAPALTLCGVFLGIALFTWRTGAFGEIASSIALHQVAQNMMGNDTASGMPLTFLQIVAAVLSLAVPVLTIGTLTLVSYVHKVPVMTGVLRGLRGLGVSLACVMFLTYALIVVGTLRSEARSNHGLQQTVQQEGLYLAHLVGQEWPGPVQK